MQSEPTHLQVYRRAFVAFFAFGLILAALIERGPAFIRRDVCHALLEPMALRSVIFLFVGSVALCGFVLSLLGANSASSHRAKRWVFDAFAVQPTMLVANLTAPMIAVVSAICLAACFFGYRSAALGLAITLIYLVLFGFMNWGIRQTTDEDVLRKLCSWAKVAYYPTWSARVVGLFFVLFSLLLLFILFPLEATPPACEG